MKILIVYATNSGGTRIAAEIVHDTLAEQGHILTIRQANNIEASELNQYNLVLLGSCTWEKIHGQTRLEGQLQQHMEALTEQAKKTSLRGQRFAVFGLGDSSYTHFCASVDRLLEFVQAVHGQLVGQPLRIDGFFFRQQENELILAKWAKSLAP